MPVQSTTQYRLARSVTNSRPESYSLIEHVIVDSNFDKSFEIIRHQHHRSIDMTKLAHLQVITITVILMSSEVLTQSRRRSNANYVHLTTELQNVKTIHDPYLILTILNADC